MLPQKPTNLFKLPRLKAHQVVTSSNVKTNDSKIIYHVVQPGDTLWKIAQRYGGMTVESIKQINRLESNDLKVGTRLKVTIGG
ncbi:MAG: LysM peptidoglycan-binding domain-containing protein [Bacteroidetes bacterium]|nr:LysM peptidoglycan-binding domain-containing protein [Bacteroidota bacterium]